MKRKNWIIGIAAVLLLVFAVKGIGHYRWSNLSAEEKAGTITEKLARHLDLRADQKQQLYALNLEKIQAMQTAHASGRHSRRQWKQLRAEWHSGLESILTPEQKEKWRH
ncbi:MAG: hypothetical protein IPM81_20595 [Saprospirales bacterium]|nr:hypothetical protein [Saprospirales bacterium]